MNVDSRRVSLRGRVRSLFEQPRALAIGNASVHYVLRPAQSILPEGSDTVVAVNEPAGRSRLSERACPVHRRRGAALEGAILAAAFAELCDVGFAAFSVENVAARARTGKASIYRRWPAKAELVLDALVRELPSPADIGLAPNGHLDDTVTTEQALHRIGETIVRILTSPAGAAMRAVKLEAIGDRDLSDLIDERFQAPRRAALLRVLERGISRGEVRPDAATPVIADVLPAVLMHRILLTSEPITAVEIREAISLVMIPLVSARGAHDGASDPVTGNRA